MTEWIDFFLYVFLVVTLWIVFPTTSLWILLAMAGDRNPQWLADHPERALRLTGNRWFIWSCYALGAVSLMALLSLQIDAWPITWSSVLPTQKWEALKDLNGVLLVGGTLFFSLYIAFFMRRLANEVPLAPRRQASLERRAIDQFIPSWLRVMIYTLAIVQLAAWLIVGVLQLYSTPGFWARFAAPVAFSGIFFFFTRMAVNRSPYLMDRILGPGYRRSEVRCAFAIEASIPLLFALQLYAEIVPADDFQRLPHLGLVLWLALGILWFSLYSRTHNPHAAPPSQMMGRLC